MEMKWSANKRINHVGQGHASVDIMSENDIHMGTAYGDTSKEAIGTAKMMASAPALLKTLERAIHVFRPMPLGCGEKYKRLRQEQQMVAVKQASAAIAKAKGKPCFRLDAFGEHLTRQEKPSLKSRR